MAVDERRENALRAIRVARGSIITTAAKWQASGQVDTSPLVEPLSAIQEALAALEAFDARRVRRRPRGAGGASSQRRRHPAPRGDEELRLYGDLRREYSGLRVSAAAMEGEADPERTLRWVTLLEQSADRCLAVLDQIDSLGSVAVK